MAKIRSKATYEGEAARLIEIYAGAKPILEILEGNTSWVIGVIGPLLDLYLKTRSWCPNSS